MKKIKYTASSKKKQQLSILDSLRQDDDLCTNVLDTLNNDHLSYIESLLKTTNIPTKNYKLNKQAQKKQYMQNEFISMNNKSNYCQNNLGLAQDKNNHLKISQIEKKQSNKSDDDNQIQLKQSDSLVKLENIQQIKNQSDNNMHKNQDKISLNQSQQQIQKYKEQKLNQLYQQQLKEQHQSSKISLDKMVNDQQSNYRNQQKKFIQNRNQQSKSKSVQTKNYSKFQQKNSLKGNSSGKFITNINDYLQNLSKRSKSNQTKFKNQAQQDLTKAKYSNQIVKHSRQKVKHSRQKQIVDKKYQNIHQVKKLLKNSQSQYNNDQQQSQSEIQRLCSLQNISRAEQKKFNILKNKKTLQSIKDTLLKQRLSKQKVIQNQRYKQNSRNKNKEYPTNSQSNQFKQASIFQQGESKANLELFQIKELKKQNKILKKQNKNLKKLLNSYQQRVTELQQCIIQQKKHFKNQEHQKNKQIKGLTFALNQAIKQIQLQKYQLKHFNKLVGNKQKIFYKKNNLETHQDFEQTKTISMKNAKNIKTLFNELTPFKVRFTEKHIQQKKKKMNIDDFFQSSSCSSSSEKNINNQFEQKKMKSNSQFFKFENNKGEFNGASHSKKGQRQNQQIKKRSVSYNKIRKSLNMT